MKKLIIFLIRIYQKYSEKNNISVCRFYPTCSEYSIEALKKYNIFKGLYLSFRRIMKCHPFNPGGYDPLL